jgi:hypothetical protein
METPDGKVIARSPARNPPRLLEALVRCLTPSAFPEVPDDLAERYRGPLPYLKDASQALPRLISRSVRRAEVPAQTLDIFRVICGVAILLAGVEAIPAAAPGRDFLLGLGLVPAFAMFGRLRGSYPGPVWIRPKKDDGKL